MGDAQSENVNPLGILIVDDEPNIRRVLSVGLESEGHKVIAVGNSRDALAEANQRSFDLAFVDLRLGTEDGMDLIPRLLAASPWIADMTMHEIDQVEFAKRIGPLLSERRFLGRGLARGMLASRFRPKAPHIWGGVRLRYPLWWGGAIFASVAINAIAAAWSNSHGQPFPAGVYLLLFAAAIISCPAIIFLARAKGIKRKTPMATDAFGKLV